MAQQEWKALEELKYFGYPNMIELYHVTSMVVAQMIDVKRVNSGRMLTDNDNVQREKFETLNEQRL